jgi:hypothetical protein
MVSGPVEPVATNEKRKRQSEARDTLSHDVDGAIDDFMSRLDVIAEKHAR